MNNAVRTALSRIHQQIPPEILNATFMAGLQSDFPTTLDDQIMKLVIDAYLRQDCNLFGGRTIQIALLGSYHEPSANTRTQVNSGTGPFSIYRIPPEERFFESLVEVQGIQYPTPHGNGDGYGREGQGGTLCAANQALLNSHNGGGRSPTPTVELMQGDVIRLHPGGYTHQDWVLSCRVAHDENMTNLNPSTIDIFAKAAVLAAKIYIYTNLIVKIDRGVIRGGSELPTIRAIVEGWGDLTAEYSETLDLFSGSTMMDVQRFASYAKFAL